MTSRKLFNAVQMAIFLLLVSGCDSGSPNANWIPLVESLESTVEAHPNHGIIIAFGSDSDEVSVKNKKELIGLADGLPFIAFVYADVSNPESAGSQILREQGMKSPANLLYQYRVKQWDTIPIIVDEATRKSVFIQASSGSYNAQHVELMPNKASHPSPDRPESR